MERKPGPASRVRPRLSPGKVLDESDFINFVTQASNSKLDQSSLNFKWKGLQAGIFHQGDERFEMPGIEAHLLSMTLSGTAQTDVTFEAMIGAGQAQLAPHALCFVPAANSAVTNLTGHHRVLHIALSRKTMNARLLEREITDPDGIRFHGFVGQNDERLAGIGVAIHRELTQPQFGYAYQIEQLARQLADRLITFASTAIIDPENGPFLSPLQLKNAMEYLERNVREDFTVNEIAAFVGVPAREFDKIFEKETGETVRHFQIERRIDIVRNWLEGSVGNFSGASLARAIGFGSVEAMDSAFRNHLGISFESYCQGRLG